MTPIPLNGYIVVRLQKEKSNVYIPEDIDDSNQKGEVIAVSGSVTEIKTGDIVMWTKFAEKEGRIDLSGKDAVYAVPASQCMVILKRKPINPLDN